jgi:hypothetical protein
MVGLFAVFISKHYVQFDTFVCNLEHLHACPLTCLYAFSLIVRMYVSVNYTFEEVITFYRPETLNLILLMFYANISSEVLADKHRCSIFRSM